MKRGSLKQAGRSREFSYIGTVSLLCNASFTQEPIPQALQPAVLFRWHNAKVIQAVPWSKDMVGDLEVNGQVVGRVQGGRETFVGPMEWRKVSEFHFQMCDDNGPCVAGCCKWKGDTYACQLAPAEAKVVHTVGNRLRMLPPHDGGVFCGTISKASADSSILWCVQDNDKSPTQLHQGVRPLSTIWPCLVALQFAEKDAGGKPRNEDGTPQTVSFELSSPPEGYEKGTRLLLVNPSSLVDATVESWNRLQRPTQHSLQLASGVSLVRDLNVFNHCRQRFDCAAEYCLEIRSYCRYLCSRWAHLIDAITGAELNVETQVLNVNMCMAEGVDRFGWHNAAHSLDLAGLISRTHASQPVAIVGGPGSGKTVASTQLISWLAMQHDGVPLMPLLVSVHRLVRIVAGKAPTDASALLVKYLHDFLSREHPKLKEWSMVLEQALEMRAAVIVLDGIENAGGREAWLRQFVIKELLQGGHRIVVTTRPEGVGLVRYNDLFVMLELQPLTPDQQRDAVRHQSTSVPRDVQEVAQRLLAFSAIRNEQDRIWEEAFTSSEVREQLECLKVPSSSLDMRQKCLDGTREVARRDDGPHSNYLKAVNAELSPALKAPITEMKAQLEKSGSGLSRTTHTVARALPQLYEKLGGAATWTGPSLWEEVMACTDEIYAVAEALLPHCQAAVTDFLQRSGVATDPEVLKFGLKDPVRLYEQAHDEYSWVSEGRPEACVRDVIRTRVVCPDGDVMANLLRNIAGLPQASQGSQPCLQLLRMNNKCDPKTLEATHLRSVVVTLLLVCGQSSIFVEMQILLAAGLKHSEDTHAEDHRDYLRQSLCADRQLDASMLRSMSMSLPTTPLAPGQRSQQELDGLLGWILHFVQEARVPVQLSMLLLILQHFDDLKDMPLSQRAHELWKQAFIFVLQDGVKVSVKELRETVATLLEHNPMKEVLDLMRMLWLCAFLSPAQICRDCRRPHVFIGLADIR